MRKVSAPILVFTLILFVLLFPNFYASRITPEGMHFTGHAVWFDPWDLNVYISAIKWAQVHGLYFQNAYTTQPHKSLLVYPIYSVAGILFPSVDPFLIFNFLTFFFSLVLLFIIYRVVKIYITNYLETLYAVFLIALGGGLGWFVFPKILSPDVSITPFTFYGTFQKPHESLAVAFYFASLALFYLAVTKRRPKLALFSTLSALFFIPFYPYHLLSLYAILGYFSVIFALRGDLKYPIFYFLSVLLITLPFGATYSLYLLSGTSFENVMSPSLGTPGIILVAVGYGVLSPILVYQLLKKKKNDAVIFLNLWFFLSLLLSYLPLSFSRYYLRGLFFPAVMLSVLCLSSLSKDIGVSKRILLLTLLVLVPLSGLHLSFKRITNAKEGMVRWYYITREEKLALEYLDKNTPEGSGVLASYILGNYIPAHSGNRVYFGHLYQTPNSKEKIDSLSGFYANAFSDEEAKGFLQKNNISYVLWGPDERKITAEEEDVVGLKYKFLKAVYENPKVIIYSYDN